MKITLYLIFLFCSIFSFSQQEGRISYRIITDNSYLNKESYKKADNFKAVLKSLDEIRDSINLFLDFKSNESIFYPDKKTNLGLSNKNGYQAVFKTLKTYYRNNYTKTLIEVVNNEKIYLVHSGYKKVKWNISNKKKKIGNYNCIKATAIVKDKTSSRGVYERLIEAWFCPEIPLSLGPNNYGDLPGLILELKEKKFTYYVTNINLSPSFKIKIKKPSKGKEISKEEYFEKIPIITRENIKEYIGN